MNVKQNQKVPIPENTAGKGILPAKLNLDLPPV
jgi:hypothetical protein